MTIKERLPVPDWTREGETWRVEPETAVAWTVDVSGSCTGRCWRTAVAGYTSRSGEFHGVCANHLAESKMWIEDGWVVSWRLSA